MREHASNYRNLLVNYVHGRDPVLTFYDAEDRKVGASYNLKELEFTRHQIGELLHSKGIMYEGDDTAAGDAAHPDGGFISE